MKIFLSGADGFLGRHAAAALRAAGHDLVLADQAEAAAILDETPDGTLERAAEGLVTACARTLEALRAKRVVVAAAADGYGECPGECTSCGRVRPDPSGAEPRCPRCEGRLEPVGVREDDRLQPATPLAALRTAREDLVLTWGRTRGVQVVSLRFFELFDEGRPPSVPGEGARTRDFVDVRDAARAVVLALEHPRAAGQVYNVGTGRPVRLDEAGIAPSAAAVGEAWNLFADAQKIRYHLGWKAERLLPAAAAWEAKRLGKHARANG